MAGLKQTLKQIWTFQKTLIVLLTPLIFLALPIAYPTKAARCAYVICIMATYWVTEAIPMAVTALLPIVLMPWLGVLGSKQICINYLKDTNMLFVGGLIVAVAVERWNLHKRIALRVLLTVGSQPKWLMFGFMSSTAFLSMWISNTATTAMMIPIAQAVLIELEGQLETTDSADETSVETPEVAMQEETTQLYANGRISPAARNFSDNVDSMENGAVKNVMENGGMTVHAADGTVLAFQPENKLEPCEEKDLEACNSRTPITKDAQGFSSMAKGMCLCVAAAANIGGTGTLTGTGPNLVFKGLIDTMYGSDSGINFSSWFIFAFPNMVVSFLLTWLWFILRFLGPRELFSWCKKYYNDRATAVIRREYNKLGPMSFAEAAVLVHFIILALLWFTREPGFIPGWSFFLEKGYVTDACVGITVCISLFIFPSQRPFLPCSQPKDKSIKPAPVPALLDWPTVQSNLAWSVILVLGGGFALADSCKHSGLSALIADFFLQFDGFPIWLMVLLLSTITAVFTEVTSNTATATIFIPILAELANSLEIHPLYLTIPVTLSASFAFMLPVATPPNAIVFAYGRLKVIDMVESGAIPKVLCILVLQLSINTYGHAFFNLGEFPSWANPGNELLNVSASGNASLVEYVIQGTTMVP